MRCLLKLDGDIKQSTSRKKLKPQSIISTTATDRKLLGKLN